MGPRRRPARKSTLAPLAALLLLASAGCERTIYQVVPVASITITGSTEDLAPGQVVQLSAHVVASDGRLLTGRRIEWMTSAAAVATVDETGRVTALSPGLATITAISEGISDGRTYTVRSPVPSISSISPATTPPNTAFTLRVFGSGFYEGSVIRWNGSNRPTTYVSPTELTTSVSASDVAVGGTVLITVFNASPGGGVSNATSLSVSAPEPCQSVPALAVGSTVSGSLGTTDCVLEDGTYADLFTLTLGAGQGVVLTMTSSQVDSYLIVGNAAGDRILAFNDNAGGEMDARLEVLLAPGSYRLFAKTALPGEVGDYVLSAEAAEAVTGCREVWIVPGVETAQDLSESDCQTPAGVAHYNGDRYRVYLTSGQSIIVEMSSTEVDSYLLLADAETGATLAEDDDGGASGGNARIAFTAPAAGVYVIEATTFSTGETGLYTLNVSTP